MNVSWLTPQHLVYAVPVAVVVGLLVLKSLIRIVLIVAVVVGVGFLVLGPVGAHLPPDVQRVVDGVTRSALRLWRAGWVLAG